MKQLKRICLFDVDGTLTKPRNVSFILYRKSNNQC
jgi:phosphoserine phosphatase